MTVTLATWNVNSLKVRLTHLLDWLAAHRADIICLQETKLVDEQFPVAALDEAGYAAAFAGQKTYNGVALLTRRETMPAPTEDRRTARAGEDRTQKRLIASTVGRCALSARTFRTASRSAATSTYKLRWIAALAAWLRDEMTRHPKLALAGDFNIARGP
jgi:exodeoxyribonuclease-3